MSLVFSSQTFWSRPSRSSSPSCSLVPTSGLTPDPPTADWGCTSDWSSPNRAAGSAAPTRPGEAADPPGSRRRLHYIIIIYFLLSGSGRRGRCWSSTTPSSTRCGRTRPATVSSSSWMCGTPSWARTSARLSVPFRTGRRVLQAVWTGKTTDWTPERAVRYSLSQALTPEPS